MLNHWFRWNYIGDNLILCSNLTRNKLFVSNQSVLIAFPWEQPCREHQSWSHRAPDRERNLATRLPLHPQRWCHSSIQPPMQCVSRTIGVRNGSCSMGHGWPWTTCSTFARSPKLWILSVSMRSDGWSCEVSRTTDAPKDHCGTGGGTAKNPGSELQQLRCSY